jgi:flagellar L-ring protein FlgH
MRSLLLISCLLVFLTGCFSLESSHIDREPFVLSKTYKTAPEKTGPQTTAENMWRGELTGLYGDQRAKSVGDIVTVKITEVSQASEKATTDTGRSSEMHAEIPNLLGFEVNHATGLFRNPANLVNAANDNTFSGSGSTTRAGSLSATITARIVEVLPNGNLAIEGKREIYVNNEKKEILLQGVIRPRDIAYDNSILSTQIADAKVIYTGIGVVAENQRPGWLMRFFNIVWPF